MLRSREKNESDFTGFSPGKTRECSSLSAARTYAAGLVISSPLIHKSCLFRILERFQSHGAETLSHPTHVSTEVIQQIMFTEHLLLRGLC